MKDNLFIVAIGGSAGSLDPLKAFFDHTPLDSAAYVIVRHLPKDFHSQLATLLKRHSKLQVVEAREGMKIEPNQVIVAPSHRQLVIRAGVFHLREIPSGPNRTIDLFFHSLAEEGLGDRAIGVIFSGAGFDGTQGAVAIKRAGGLVIAQQPHSCEYASMPEKAIQSGVVDLVKRPFEMPAAIQAYVHSPRVPGNIPD